MTDSHRSSPSDTFLAPWANLWQAPHFWNAFGNSAKVAEPIARSAASAQLELTSLVGHRAKAWAAIPETMSRCRTPMELMQAQMAFWQEAGRNYTESTQRVMSVWQAALPVGFVGPDGEGVMPRDYITFPEPKPDAAGDERRRPGESRRAA